MRVISLFSGAGGMDLGFVQAGYSVAWANDIWRDAVETYRLNFGPHTITCANIAEIDVNEIPAAEVLIGGFPCQGFSVANRNRHASDTRNSLYLQFLRVLRAKEPLFFVAENVKGIKSLSGGRVFRMIISDFESAGYVLQHSVINAADFGVPQKRERVFFFGYRNDIQDRLVFPPSPTHAPRDIADTLGLKPWVGVGDALAIIPDPDEPNGLENHDYTKYKLRFNGYLGHRIVRAEEPAPTITARGDDKGGVVIHHHPNNRRRLSARETAYVQSFPLDYKFFGTKTSVYRQVANAVPPTVARAIAEWLRDTVRNVALPLEGIRSDVALAEACCDTTEKTVS